MIKKIILIFILSSLALSCGIKDDPEYKSNRNNTLKSKV
jgi:hypothetical protein